MQSDWVRCYSADKNLVRFFPPEIISKDWSKATTFYPQDEPVIETIPPIEPVVKSADSKQIKPKAKPQTK